MFPLSFVFWVIIRLFSKLCPSLWQMSFIRLEKKRFYWGLLQFCPSVDSVFALIDNHKGFTGMILWGAFFLHPLPMFCWPEMSLTSSDHLHSLFASEPESMALAVCLFVLPGSKMCPFVSASASWLVIQERLLSAMPTERKQQCFLLRWLLCLESKETC